MDERNSQYRLESARSGCMVPVINDVYLHSIYNPEKEAITFAQKYESSLKIKSSVLVLGLGFGYHIEEISKMVTSFHKDSKIFVLEPNQRLVDDFINSKSFTNKNIKIICNSSAKELFTSLDFVSFLMNKPCIIKHDSSFVVNKEFYASVLSYKAPTDVYNLNKVFNSDAKYIFENSDATSIDNTVEHLKQNGLKSKNDFLLMAFNEIRTTKTQR